MSFLEEIEQAGKRSAGFWRWFSTVENRAPMKATVGINGKIVFKPRSHLDPLSEAEFNAAMDRIDELFAAQPGTPEGYELEALSIAVERYEKAAERDLEDLAGQMDR